MGDHLTREMIVNALCETAKVASRTFASDAATPPVPGVVIHLKLDGHDDAVPIFFTDEHARSWREFTEAP